MKLSAISIQNFRSIKDCNVSFKEVTAIVGENNAGKTALLKALNSVFNWEREAASFADNTHQYAPRAITKIAVSFEEVPIKPVYVGKKLGDKLVIVFSYSYSNTKRRKTLICRTDTGDVAVDDSFILELKKDIDYIYIPADRGNKDLEWAEDTIFQKVLSSYARHHSEKRDTISNKVIYVAEILKRNVFSKLEMEIGKASMLEDAEYYNLQYKEPLDYSMFLNKVGLNIMDNGRDFPVTEYGSGIKSLSVIALYRVLARLENVNVVLGIEEPETNLHPHAQKRLIASIMNERQNTEVQAIMATHSTVIVDELSHEDIILARRTLDDKRGYYTTFTQLNSDFWTTYGLDEYKHNNFFQYKNSEFFFAKYVVVVESITDAQVINKLIEEDIGNKRYFISILNLDGVKNLKYPYFLLKELGIPFSMVVDHDFLTAYKNDKLDSSRDETTYLPEYKDSINVKNAVIKNIWNTPQKICDLTNAANQSYTKMFEFCRNEKLYSMQYCLEMDLVAGVESRKVYCSIMGIPFDGTEYKKLLIDKKDAIKSPEKIMLVVSSLTPSQYPYSFKKIRAALISDINETN